MTKYGARQIAAGEIQIICYTNVAHVVGVIRDGRVVLNENATEDAQTILLSILRWQRPVDMVSAAQRTLISRIVAAAPLSPEVVAAAKRLERGNH
jgi:hypothetical protein